jgi:uncharacterized protein (DUF2126 family)/transglutaminase-like putative cysteine protease
VSIHVALNHASHYRYDRAVALGPQLVRLRPAPHCRTRILSYSMRVLPAQHFINWQQDPQANYLARLVFPERTQEFRVEIDLIAEMAVLNPFDFFLTPYAESTPFEYEATELSELGPFLARGEATPLFAEYLARIPRQPMRTIDFLVELNQRLARDIRYLIRMEPGVQAPELTLSRAAGSCRDSGWLLVQLLRHMGLAARFVSGYLIQLKSDVKPLEGPAGPEHDFTDLHAWCEVYLPGAGWIGLDPTSGLMAGEGHIPLACTPEPSAAAPISGEVDQSEVQFEHQMSVARVWEAPRVTKPYTEAQWAAIGRLGERIDAELEHGDVRLTMGGEPTFVSLDDPDGAEWNTSAMGPNKRKLAAQLYHRLREHYAPHALVHFGQGKWYPGEQLPRWSLNCYWRRDGEPIWAAPALIADENRDYGVTAAHAQQFLQALAARLGLDARHVFAGFEDVFYYLWRERRLPVNVDPLDSRLDDEQERARLMRVFSHGLARIAGHALPIARDASGTRWQSGRWFLRDERCYLIPGDSPMGYRLPLDSQPWVARSDYPYVHTPDPTQSFAPLPRYAQVLQQMREGGGAAMVIDNAAGGAIEAGAGGVGIAAAAGGAAAAGITTAGRSAAGANTGTIAVPGRLPAPHESASWITRSAMCVEARNGVLYVFMPPLERAADYLALVAAVEATAAALKQPVMLEGYEPPRDPGLINFRITPDPGVIEANIHPAHDWAEMVERTTFLYQAAHELRLGTEKFMLDGRHTGTGGGNHFVLGGATALDSPFLRRPDLLASLLAYWHNHPSLSYLFSGLFVGPTSQAPRVDEARNDSLYELELALQQLPAPDSEVPPWLTDRLFRNLLIDVSGNTHRTEFCIDKLYSPDGPNGRLGLLELRAFEMPPHHRMSLTQQLLLRSLVARFWRVPYKPARLARWGTELHDRFMLPHFVEQDFRDVLTEQREAGYALDAAWFAPHFEFRFPKYGDFAAMGVEVELRQALEPWHVMGEEGAAGGAVRYVDSSVERVQVKATGLAPDRYAIACNGRRVPLRPTGVPGEFVAGVRYRAWQPASALHPRLGVNSPLTFDLVDTWMQRSLGGCQYHVTHPGGRSYSTFPVNSFEAESRRLGRFFRIGYTPASAAGAAFAAREWPNPDFPFTLDLRRSG